MVWKCSVPQCTSTRKTAKMHRCRRRNMNMEVFKIWLQFVGETFPPVASIENIFICEKHFSHEQTFHANSSNRTNLKFNAFPDQAGPCSENQLQNNNQTSLPQLVYLDDERTTAGPCSENQSQNNNQTSLPQLDSSDERTAAIPCNGNQSQNNKTLSPQILYLDEEITAAIPCNGNPSHNNDQTLSPQIVYLDEEITAAIPCYGNPSQINDGNRSQINNENQSQINNETSLPQNVHSDEERIAAVPLVGIQLQNNDTRTTSCSEVVNSVDERTPDASVIEIPRRIRKVWNTPKKSKDLLKGVNLLDAVDVKRRTALTPKARKLYDIGLKFKKFGKRLLSQNNSYKNKIKRALNFVEDNPFLEVNNITRNFMKSQLRLQKKAPRGRRFNIDDKILALSLIRKGPKVYKLLRTMFALPSRRTLRKLLEKLPFNVGRNPAIMASLKEAVQQLNPLDRTCVLMFDEMFLDAGLSLNIKEDCIEGFHDTGAERKLLFANHAFVIMVRGVRRAWKQPIAYYFVHNSMTAAMIKKELKNIIVDLQEIGLQVIATVCDQANTNVSAIDLLIKETREKYLKSDASKLSGLLGFEIESNKEIIAIYDPPHLLKGIRNNFIQNDAVFAENLETVLEYIDPERRGNKRSSEQCEPTTLKKVEQNSNDPKHPGTKRQSVQPKPTPTTSKKVKQNSSHPKHPGTKRQSEQPKPTPTTSKKVKQNSSHPKHPGTKRQSVQPKPMPTASKTVVPNSDKIATNDPKYPGRIDLPAESCLLETSVPTSLTKLETSGGAKPKIIDPERQCDKYSSEQSVPSTSKQLQTNNDKATSSKNVGKHEKKATWNDIVEMYRRDGKFANLKICPKLTDAHIYQDKLKKMKVRNAAQVLSRSVSAALWWMKKKGKTYRNTSDFALFFDQLFDSFNGVAVKAAGGKFMRTAVTRKSKHLHFWNLAITALEGIAFVSKKGYRTRPPSLKHWTWNIRCMRHLWNSLRSKGFKYLAVRHFNQDPLENLFGMIRSHGVRNTQPTPTSFRDSFKTVILNNYLSSHSPNANCEKDGSAGALQNLKKFVTARTTTAEEKDVDTVYYNVEPAEFSFSTPTIDVVNLHAYVAGAVGKRLLATVKKCSDCTKNLLASEVDCSINSESFKLIEAKRYCPAALLKPNSKFIQLFSEMVDVANFFLPRLCLEPKICAVIRSKITDLVDSPLTCEQHASILFEKSAKIFVKLFVCRWIREVNSTLKGLMVYEGEDIVKCLASTYCAAHKTKKNAINKIKRLNE